MTASNQVFSAFSFMTFVLVLIPLSWHLEAWNTGTVLYMMWTAISLLFHFINSVVWNGNVVDRAPVYCDIATKLIIGSAIGIPCASLCINRRLYYISGVRAVTTTRKDKLRQIGIDLAIGAGIPVLIMGLHVIVQGHRYDIFEDLGCLPTTYNVTLAYVLMQIPALTIPLVAGVYAILSIRTFARRQAEFKTFLSSGTSGSLSQSRYLRLIALASVEVLFTFPISLTYCILQATVNGPVNPWISWADTHFGFWDVPTWTLEEWKSSTLNASIAELSRWSGVVCGLVFFAFFGFAQEARSNYKRIAGKVCGVLGVKNPFEGQGGSKGMFTSKSSTLQGSSNFSKFKISTPGTEGNSSHSALPIYVQKEVVNKRDSLDSFSDFMSVRSGGECATLSKPAAYTLPAGLSGPTTNSNTSTVIGTPSAPSSRSGSPVMPSGRPRIEISSAIYTDGVDTSMLRTPESAFPRGVTPEAPPSFLEMSTPAPESLLSRRADNRV